MKRYGLGRAIIFIIVGIVFFGIFVYRHMPMWGKPVDFYNMSWKELGNKDHVKIDVKYAVDSCVSVETTTTKNGKVTSKKETSRLYLIPTFTLVDGYTRFDKFFLVEVPAKEFAKAEKIIDETMQWWTETVLPEKEGGTTYEVDGYTEELSAQEIRYAKDYTEEFLSYMYDNEVVTKDVDKALFTGYKVVVYTGDDKPFLIIGGVFVGIGAIVLLIVILVGKSKAKAEANGVGVAQGNVGNMAYTSPQYDSSVGGSGFVSHPGVNYDPNKGTAENTTNGYNYSQGTTYNVQGVNYTPEANNSVQGANYTQAPVEQPLSNGYGFSPVANEPAANAQPVADNTAANTYTDPFADTQQSTYRGTSPDK